MFLGEVFFAYLGDQSLITGGFESHAFHAGAPGSLRRCLVSIVRKAPVTADEFMHYSKQIRGKQDNERGNLRLSVQTRSRPRLFETVQPCIHALFSITSNL